MAKKASIVTPAPHHLLPHLAAITDHAEAASESTKGYLDGQGERVGKLAAVKKFLGVGEKPRWVKEVEELVEMMEEVGKDAATFGSVFYEGVEEERVVLVGKNVRSALLLLGYALSSLYQDGGKRGEEARGEVESLAKRLQRALLELANVLAGQGFAAVEWNDVFDIIMRCQPKKEKLKK